jgi:streptomycin 6-kinase
MDLLWHMLRFKLESDGPGFETHSSWLMPVRWKGQLAMLKVFKPQSDEKSSGEILKTIGGTGAVQVFEGDEEALVLERAGPETLLDFYTQHRDGPTAEILLDVVAKLHDCKHITSISALPLNLWFESLYQRAGALPLLARCSEVAQKLLNSSQQNILLHGDLHHENVLASPRGWLAIDPKGLFGDPVYDVANLFCNPLQDAATVLQPERMRWLARLCSERLGMTEQRVLQFAYAHAGLSISWEINDGRDFSFRQKCAEGLEQALKLA